MKQTIYHSMVLTENDIRVMVTECVQHILEVRGAIDDKLLGLARLIVDKIKDGEERFSLKKNIISEYYPYANCPKELNISVEKMGLAKMAVYIPTKSMIKISSLLSLFSEDFLLQAIVHELTHFVNDSESHGEWVRKMRPNFKDEGNEGTARKILYLFDTSEMAARVSQFKSVIENARRGKLSDYESTTHLNLMKKLINAVENDVLLYTDDFSIVEALLYSRAFKKTAIDSKDRELNISYENFEAAKTAIVNKLSRAYKNFYTKIAKVYYDAMGSLSIEE